MIKEEEKCHYASSDVDDAIPWYSVLNQDWSHSNGCQDKINAQVVCYKKFVCKWKHACWYEIREAKHYTILIQYREILVI